MLDYLTDVKPLEDAGKTDAEIVEILGYFTAQPITPDAARVYFAEVTNSTPIWSDSPSGWTGKMQNAYVDPNLPPADKKALDRLWVDVFGGDSDNCQTTLQLKNNGVDAKGFQPGLPLGKALVIREAKGNLSTAEVAGFYDLGGGRPYASAVVADVATARAVYDAAAAIEADRVVAEQEFTDMKTRGVAAWDAAEIEFLAGPNGGETLVEWQARIKAAGEAAFAIIP